jgi:hypothetical protein
MKNATELLKAYLAQIQDPAAAAALFADDGVIELPGSRRVPKDRSRSNNFSRGCSQRCLTSASRTSGSGLRRPTRPSPTPGGLSGRTG